MILAIYIKPKGEDFDLATFCQDCLNVVPKVSLYQSHVGLLIENKDAYCAAFHAQLKKLIQSHAIKTKLAYGINISEALAKACFQKKDPLELPLAALQFYLAPTIQSTDLSQDLRHLNAIGIYQLHALNHVPLASLGIRMSPSFIDAYQAFLNRDPSLHWHKISAPKKWRVIKYFSEDQNISHLESIFFVLRPLVQTLMQQLKQQGRVPHQSRIVLEQEANSLVLNRIKLIPLSFHFPIREEEALLNHIRHIMYEKLGRDPLSSPLSAIAIEVLHTDAYGALQKNFFSAQEEKKISFQALFNRIESKLGKHSVFFAHVHRSYIPELGWQKSKQKSGPASLPLALRPSRVLPQAVPIGLKQNSLYFGNKGHLIDAIKGPEHIESEWWNDYTARHYYHVKLKNQQTYWIYQDVQTQNYFLQGIFE